MPSRRLTGYIDYHNLVTVRNDCYLLSDFQVSDACGLSVHLNWRLERGDGTRHQKRQARLRVNGKATLASRTRGEFQRLNADLALLSAPLSKNLLPSVSIFYDIFRLKIQSTPYSRPEIHN